MANKFNKSYIFPYIEKGSNYLLKEFPNEKTYQDSKEKLKNFNPKLKEECGVFGISNAKDASASDCFRTSCFTTSEVKKVVELSLLMVKNIILKKDLV